MPFLFLSFYFSKSIRLRKSHKRSGPHYQLTLLANSLRLTERMTHPIDNAFKRISNFSKSRDVPLDMPYKADKVLGYDTDRKYSACNTMDII